MAKRGTILVVGSVLILGLGLGCSSDEDDSDDGGSMGAGNRGNTSITGSGGVPQSQSDSIRDLDGDGVVDPLVATDFGVAGVAITEADIQAMREQACTGWVAEPEPIGATLFWVLDASSSMRDPPPEGGNRNKWEVTREALVAAVGELRDDTALGMLAYPNKVISGQAGDPSNCVNIDALTPLAYLDDAHRQAMIDAINAVQTNTCTPTLDAYNAAVQEFVETPAPGQKYIMLMTDGQPTLDLNCSPGQCSNDLPGSEQPVIDAIAAAYNNYGIKTFVLGCPGSETHSQTGRDNRWWLSQAAELGGTSPGNCSHDGEPYCHFDMTGPDINFAAELNAALVSIVGQVVSCDYAIPLPPEGLTIDLNAINLILRPDGGDPIQILRNENPGCQQGWYYDEASQLVRLCPDTCALAQSDPNAALELMFGCTSDVLVPE
jgi:hypothetical protein